MLLCPDMVADGGPGRSRLTAPPPEPTPEERIARLERRLAREREARREAERIAEGGTRSLFEQQRRLELIQAVAAAANHMEDPADAFRFAVERICDHAGWPTGHVWMFPDEDVSGLLVSSGVWHPLEAEDTPFRVQTRAMSFPRGVGLPGRVLDEARAIWAEDVTVEENFPRAASARESGLRAGFAFPALIGDEVAAVLEFFQRRPVPPDPQLLETLDQIGAVLGRVVERHRAAARLHRHNQDLAAQRDAAEQASRAKSAFLAVTSHEVRTPLNAVLGLAEALKRQPLTPDQHELNDGVLASGQMLLRLLNAVLDMSRIDQAVARMDDFDLRAKLRLIVGIWTPHAQELGASLALDAAALTVERIRSDEGRFEQTLVNLISNALKFTPRGGEVLVRAIAEGQQVRLEVIDEGPGVADEDRDRIFQPFEQTEAGRQAGGAGLGLSICSGNVRLLGGEIGADRDDRGRSRFWFTCPFETASAGEAFEATEEDLEAAPGLRVLAAEDNPANRRVLEVLLGPAGVDLTFAENGAIALGELERGRFDLVLMDANMPVMDGIEAVRRIRAESMAPDTPIYMLTANAFAEDVERYMAAGADGVLTKPIQIDRLFAVLGGCGREVSAGARDAA